MLPKRRSRHASEGWNSRHTTPACSPSFAILKRWPDPVLAQEFHKQGLLVLNEERVYGSVLHFVLEMQEAPGVQAIGYEAQDHTERQDKIYRPPIPPTYLIQSSAL